MRARSCRYLCTRQGWRLFAVGQRTVATTRRSFMATALGIELPADVLPFSNLPAYLPPFLLGPDRAMTMVPLSAPA